MQGTYGFRGSIPAAGVVLAGEALRPIIRTFHPSWQARRSRKAGSRVSATRAIIPPGPRARGPRVLPRSLRAHILARSWYQTPHTQPWVQPWCDSRRRPCPPEVSRQETPAVISRQTQSPTVRAPVAPDHGRESFRGSASEASGPLPVRITIRAEKSSPDQGS